MNPCRNCLLLIPLLLSCQANPKPSSSEASLPEDSSAASSAASEESINDSLDSSESESASSSDASSSAAEKVISLYNETSHLFITDDIDANNPTLKTYRHASHDDVPYVELSEANTAFARLVNGVSPCEYVRNRNGTYALTKKNTSSILFSPEKQMVTVNQPMKFYEDVFSANNGIGGDPAVDLNLLGESEKTRYVQEDADTVYELKHYQMDIVSEEGHLYVPFALMNQLLAVPYFTGTCYSGVDFYSASLLRPDRLSSRAFSGDKGFVFSFNKTQDSKVAFIPAIAAKSEKYRYTAKYKTLKGQPCTVYLRLLPDGTLTMKSDEESLMGPTVDYTGTYTESGDVLSLHMEAGGISLSDDVDFRISRAPSYYGATKRSEEMALAHYYALCMQLDYAYGLKSFLNVSDFDAYCRKLEIRDKLINTDTATYYDALSRFLYGGEMGDNHVTLLSEGVYSQNPARMLGVEYADIRGDRAKAFTDGVSTVTAHRSTELYNVHDDTLVLGFGQFTYNYYKDKNLKGYTSYVKPEGVPIEKAYFSAVSTDTFAGLSMAINDALTKPEIKNIVFDVTINIGGYAMLIPLLCAFMTDDPSLCYGNSLSGARVEAHYKVDLNGDGKFGQEDDTLKDRFNWYVMAAEGAFSAGNLFPASVKGKGYAKLIGHKTVGGACAVSTRCDLTGYLYGYSSNYVFYETLKDGSHSIPEKCVEPEIALDYETMFDVKKLSAALKSLNA